MRYLVFVLFIVGCAEIRDVTNTNLPGSQPIVVQETDSTPIVDEMISPAYIARYKKEFCEKKSQDDCNGELAKSVSARLDEEYPYADSSEVLKKCQAHRFDCDAKHFELWMKLSHLQRMNQARYEQGEREGAQNINTLMNILGGISTIRSTQPTNCTSNRIGNSVYTNCR